MIVNNENENDIKLLNIDKINDNFNSVKTIYNGKISVDEFNNNNNNINNLGFNGLSKSKNSIISKIESTNSTAFQILTKEKRQALYGIDCISDVVFSKWKVGNEYVKVLTIKNITTKTQKIKYCLPDSKIFLLDFPQTITLCAGMSASIPITFIPEEKKIYKEILPIDCSYGRFYINLSSSIPKHSIDIPRNISFGYCPVNEIVRKTFILKNTGELTTTFEWKVCKPYSIIPEKGKIEPKKSLTMEVLFQPYEASVFNANVICVYGDDSNLNLTTLQKCLKIDGIGKFSYINIENNVKEFDFGEAYIGEEMEYPFNIVNYSNVVSNFKITSENKKTKSFFKFLSTSGSILPGEVYKNKVIYTPNCPNLNSIEYFNIETVSGNTLNIKCSGIGRGPSVSLSSSIINFNAVEEGTKNTKIIYLRNTSKTKAFFNFQIEEGAVFQFDKISGIVNPESELLITVTFQPFKTINYYRRVYCLIENSDTLYIDILGTCFNEKRRPVTLSTQNFEAYKKRIDNGLFFLSPENLDEMIKNNFIIYKDGGLSFSTSKTYVQSKKIEENPYEECKGSSNFYNQDSNQNLEVTLVDPFIDFGSCSMYKIIEGKTIKINNNTRGTLACVWILPGETKKTKSEDVIFSVTPKTATILPKGSYQFKVTFKPQMENKLYSTELECYCYYKSMRNFRIVSEQTLTPSWCLTPKIIGDTFSPDINNFLPNIEFSNKIINFPSCILKKTYYRTISIKNSGDTTVKYSFMNEDELQDLTEDNEKKEEKKKIFSIKEANGVLMKNEAKLMVVRYEPVEEKYYNIKQNCYLNNSYKNKYELTFKGECDYPNIVFDNNNTIFFKPVCINSSTEKTFNGRNISNIKLYYKWKIPNNYKNIAIISPMQGIINPNEIVTMNCIFIPSSIKNWTIRIPCYYSSDINVLNDAFNENSETIKEEYQNLVKRSTLTILGQGIIGHIVSDQTNIDYGAILINTNNEKEFRITNPSKCDMEYDIKIYKVKKVVLSEEEKKKIILKRQEKIRKKIMEEEKMNNNLGSGIENKKGNINENGGDRIRTETNNENNNSNNNEVFDFNNKILNGTEDKTEYINDKDYEKEELVKDDNNEILILGIDNELSSHAGRNLKIRLNLKEEQYYKYRIYYTLNSYQNKNEENTTNSILKPRTKEKKYFLMEITAQGVYPSLWINDISSDGYVKSLLWELFDLNNFNHLTRKIFIDKELNNEIEENKMLIDRNKFENNTNNCLSQVLFQFGSIIVGSPCTDIYVNFNNNGVVPVEWKYQFPNDFQNDIEKWAKGEITSDEQLKFNMILDNQIFSITPKSGYLLPGESINVKFSYKHDIVGTHRLPVILKIQNGSITETKDLIITLSGCTIPLNKKYIMFPSMSYRFKDVSISTSYPPIQHYLLRNCGSTNIEYIIDTTPLEQLKKDNYNFEILKCLNSSGVISPGESQSTEWIFKPLEAKEYSVDIPIHIKDGQTKIITFTGKGVRYTMPYANDVDLEDPLKDVNNDNISHKQLLKIPNQIVMLSDERIHFGHIPTGSILRRIITIKNISSTEKVSFTWMIKDDQDEIKINPKSGTLEPGESRLCKIRFKPCNQSKIYALNIGCVIVNLTKMDKYYIKKREVEAIINKKKYLRKLSLNLINEKSADNIVYNKMNYNIRKTKYNPLPPIESSKSHENGNELNKENSHNEINSNQYINSHNQENTNDNNDINSKMNDFGRNDFPELPKPPNPSTISIEIISESHEPFEYKKYYKNFDYYYFEKESFDVEEKVLNDDAMSIIFSSIQFMLNNILQDLEIQNLTNHLKFESLPYFSQIRAITKPELSTFDNDKEVQKVETSKIDNIIVSSYGMVDNSLNNEVFKMKNGFKPRINSYVNPMPKIKEKMNNNPLSVSLEDNYIDIYGLNDERILSELTALDFEEKLNNLHHTIMNNNNNNNNGSNVSLANDTKSYINSNISIHDNNNDNNNNENNNDDNNLTDENNNNNNNNNNKSSSNTNLNNNKTNSNININNKSISESNNLSISNTNINKSESYNNNNNNNQSQILLNERNYNPNRNVTNSHSLTLSHDSLDHQNMNNNNNNNNMNNNNNSRGVISTSNSLINSINEYFMNPNQIESVESIHDENAIIFPDVADGQTIKIIQNNDFQNLLEEILESTIFNILQEANAGEFDLTKKPAFCYYKTFNNCKNIIGSESSFNINNNNNINSNNINNNNQNNPKPT
ncbi:hypothetical protein BCR32DRAFT_295949 [Anaeromyces robustus]|uniref:MSP domain-containing protein n=1 Tax=Anaeromyces robustus TaxID=1754192 RepID=A0A1Y1WUT6_9FUNG|nr:hypothetical protein BCR32DRAFT_295949 [Anaeromyces robustus]|eukprot:ORX76894.1 hypothetical protein BCR32DRAFT_295949 [Anaeromyces robustus]